VRGRALVIATIVLGAAACGGSRGELEARRQRWAVERRALDDDLDRLEERLLASQARVRFWQEMKARHETVSAVACTNLSEHAAGMAAIDEKQREKQASLVRKNRIAAAHLVPAAEAAR
jgi:hypothetical protein